MGADASSVSAELFDKEIKDYSIDSKIMMIGLFLNHYLTHSKEEGILHLSPEDMQEAKKSTKEKGIKAKDVKNLPPIEEIHGFNTPPPPPVVEVSSLLQFDEGDIPYNKHPSQCLDEFDNYVLKQESFNARVFKQLKYHDLPDNAVAVFKMDLHTWLGDLVGDFNATLDSLPPAPA
jgi:hypothetical protein